MLFASLAGAANCSLCQAGSYFTGSGESAWDARHGWDVRPSLARICTGVGKVEGQGRGVGGACYGVKTPLPCCPASCHAEATDGILAGWQWRKRRVALLHMNATRSWLLGFVQESMLREWYRIVACVVRHLMIDD